MDTRRRTATFPLIAVLIALLVLGAACSSGAGDEASSGEGAAPEQVDDVRSFVAKGAPDAAEGAGGSGQDSASSTSTPAADLPGRAIISTGVVSLRDVDVAAARFEVQKILDTRRGEIAEEKTQTDDDGAVSRSRIVARVPVADFEDTMEELEGVAELESSSRSSEDVTTAVIDNEARIRAQTASLERIEVLLARATSIQDIVSIEAQLTHRQAELDSLKQRQAYLADQTSLSTITIFLEHKPDPSPKPADSDRAGFLAGLGAGWAALETFGTGFATVLGAVLPFAGLLLLLGVPALLLIRRLAHRRPAAVTVGDPAGTGDQTG